MSRDRRWLELRVRGPSDREDDPLLAEGLLALGGRAVEERDGWYLTHLGEPDDLLSFLDRARRSLEEMVGPDVVLEHRWQDHEDWVESWKRGLRTRHVTERLVVTPSWIPYRAAEGEHVLVLDPGMAFGTAEHGTTRGCLRLLDRVLGKGERVVDVGAGSGILSIAAALLGAGEVVAVEGDELACEAMDENLERNDVGARVRVVSAWADRELLARHAPSDGVVANIEWHRLRPLFPWLAETVRPGGWMILSGILKEEVVEVEELASSLGLRVRGADADGEWRSILLERAGEE
jgi:ribosomal protein L11 methyltransferase